MSRKCLGAKADGSSPLARGLPVDYDGGVAARRIIPARAGFTRRGRSRLGTHRDHPRSRGVYRGRRRVPDALRGSSPLARGLLLVNGERPDGERIIPARAGFTACRCGPGSRSRDHPRSRGVYSSPMTRPSSTWGSSPLARGLQHFQTWEYGPVRIIPARAGFTVRHPGDRRRRGDHPRSRGVYVGVRRRSPRPSGSSPLARGLRRAHVWAY